MSSCTPPRHRPAEKQHPTTRLPHLGLRVIKIVTSFIFLPFRFPSLRNRPVLLPVTTFPRIATAKLFALRSLATPLRSRPSTATTHIRRRHLQSAMAALSAQTFSPAEESEIQKWVAASESIRSGADGNNAGHLDALETHLATRTTVLGSKPSRADVSLYQTLAPVVAAWSPDERSGVHGRPNIVRHLDFVQNAASVFELAVKDKVPIDQDDVRYVKPVVDAKAEKERLKKEKAAAAAAAAGGSGAAAVAATATDLVDRTKEKVKELAADAQEAVAPKQQKKEKKEKAPKQAKPAPAAAAPPSPCLIDLRVGHILKAVNHPDADSLYVSTIAMGDAPNDDTAEYEGQVCRTVCSGLNGLIPLAEMQGRKVVVVCNLKPVKMRGVKSCAMVLAASPRIKEGEVDDHKGPVELVAPPADSKAGDRVFFEGWKGEPEGVLNPKKKIWELFQPGFTTTDTLDVVFDAAAVESLGKTDLGRLVTESGGVCTVQTLKGATVR
ncbi:multisynthetase complex auxiliary component p43 [Cordyceps militaris CM01]|uniref:Multisynthetase complex auxiliary component p43 n=1 Tax=Cordyceps militaris (strain CM01) TaxID=983644 RepID=G3JSG0_CORMM|nr:multisynthetase complex auxiliary component p43 [Cordyceps militaris CM01]EGX88752.1 multisynthetase complex auxiliary component p43 [Cordyceps militaris CM01]